MWSDRYYYLNIYYDKNLSVSVDTVKLRTFLLSITEIKKESNFIFTNQSDFPFTEILLLNARNIDNWSDKDVDEKKTNLITIVCSKDNDINFEKLKNTFIKIAKFLDWKLIDERTDDGNEDFILWKPEK